MSEKINNFPIHSYICCIDAYKKPENENEWKECPRCKLKPLIWEFDNGRSTCCGCWEDRFRGFSVSAESIMSVLKRTGAWKEYDENALMNNWNNYTQKGFKVNLPKGCW